MNKTMKLILQILAVVFSILLLVFVRIYLEYERDREEPLLYTSQDTKGVCNEEFCIDLILNYNSTGHVINISLATDVRYLNDDWLYENWSGLREELRECWEFNKEYCLYEIDNVSVPRSGIISRIKPGATSFEVTYSRQIYIINKDSRYYWLECGSESMKPVFNCNSTLVVYKPEKGEIFVGDIIGFKTPEYPSGDFVIHRVVGKEGDEYITKGDSNKYLDSYKVKFKNVEYKIISINY